ncbi:MFS general substrate transporter [Hypoxylon sp. FL1284]|nr:MFS general substrate transporter [Hypoxylon sp. FL1284]
MDDSNKSTLPPRGHDGDEAQRQVPDAKDVASQPPSSSDHSDNSDHSSMAEAKDLDSGNSSSSEDAAEDVENLSRVPSGPAYSVFTQPMIRWIVFMCFVSAFVSPLTANIYFPALPVIANELGVSINQINLTLTTYMIFQGLAPTFFGDFGDAAGRRPAFIIAFVIYFGANIGLALQRNYAALLVLRMVQSGGSSGTLALVYAVVADTIPSSERAKYLGIVGAGQTVGPALGPVIGGLLSQYLGWPSIFWFLCILTISWLIPYVLTVPETGRKVVGNGSVPPRGWNMTLIDYIRSKRQPQNQSSSQERQKIRFPNPFNTLAVLRNKDMALVLGFNAIVYIAFILTTSTLSSQFAEIYGFNDIQLSLCYLPIGAATTIASISNGYVANWNFRRIAKKMGVTIDRKRGNDLRGFPIEKVRLQIAYPYLLIGGLIYIGYGWALHFETPVAVPLVLLFFIGYFVTGPFHVINMLIVDLYPEAPATATAANNLCRCLSGAAATAVIQSIIDSWGRGWAFTFIALLFLALSPILLVIQKYGPQWRDERFRKMNQAAEMRQVEAQEKATALAEKSDGVVTAAPYPCGETSACKFHPPLDSRSMVASLKKA